MIPVTDNSNLVISLKIDDAKDFRNILNFLPDIDDECVVKISVPKKDSKNGKMKISQKSEKKKRSASSTMRVKILSHQQSKFDGKVLIKPILAKIKELNNKAFIMNIKIEEGKCGMSFEKI